jgi:hydrogenase assembly chaperone HypC/HupF
MCIGIPMQVIEPMGPTAWCMGRDGRRLVDMRLVGPQPAGAWILTHLEAAREILSEQSAREIDRALDALAAALNGDAAGIEAGFADLIGREPQLPAHLRKENA